MNCCIISADRRLIHQIAGFIERKKQEEIKFFCYETALNGTYICEVNNVLRVKYMTGWIQKTMSKKDNGGSDSPIFSGGSTSFYLPAGDPGREKKILNEKIFIKYPDRMEGSGKRRVFISESGLDPYFEIFIWEDNDQKVRIDFHYSVRDNERMLSWNKNTGFIHTAVNSEVPDLYGRKKSQTASAEADFNWHDIRENFIKRMNATYGIFENHLVTSARAYSEMRDILEFILKTIDDKYFRL